MPSQDVERHIATVRELSKPAGPLAPNAPTATTSNTSWWLEGEPTPARRQIHRRLLAQARDAAPHVQQERRALVLAGPPGAGKSVARKAVLGNDEAKYLVVDADDFKKALLHEAIADGSYESWIKPSEVRDLEAAGDQFYPLELAALVHEESSYLAKRMRERSIGAGDNLVIDTVLSNEDVALGLGRQLEAGGYEVQVVDVEVPFEVSEARIRGRWFDARRDAEQGLAGSELGGRWVPSEYARDVFNGPEGRSKPEAAARRLAAECAAVSDYRVYRTSVEAEQKARESGQPGAQPTLDVHKGRSAPGRPLVAAEAAAKESRVRASWPKQRGRGGSDMER